MSLKSKIESLTAGYPQWDYQWYGNFASVDREGRKLTVKARASGETLDWQNWTVIGFEPLVSNQLLALEALKRGYGIVAKTNTFPSRTVNLLPGTPHAEAREILRDLRESVGCKQVIFTAIPPAEKIGLIS